MRDENQHSTILQEYKEKLPEFEPAWPHEVRRAVKFIYEHLFDSRLSVTWLKEQCRINGEYFSIVFKRCTGKSIKQFIQHHRLKAAAHILTDESLQDLPILRLAIDLGYSGKGAFIHAFKKQEGISPGRWRRHLG